MQQGIPASERWQVSLPEYTWGCDSPDRVGLAAKGFLEVPTDCLDYGRVSGDHEGVHIYGHDAVVWRRWGLDLVVEVGVGLLQAASTFDRSAFTVSAVWPGAVRTSTIMVQ